MNRITTTISAMAAALILAGSCQTKGNKMNTFEKGTFGYDLNFLSAKDSLVILKSEDGLSQVIVSPKYQGKVFTSTLDGPKGQSLGWVNHPAFEALTPDEHFNCYGGENRFWIGPEGGRFSVFFKEGKKQVYENWHTPKELDTDAWSVEKAGSDSVSLSRMMEIKNYQGINLKIRLDRKVRLLDESGIREFVGEAWDDGLKCVAYRTENKVTNLNDFRWDSKTGAVCVWMLDMYPVSERAWTVVPFNPGSEDTLGKEITSDYFGEIPYGRLLKQDSVFFLRTDGKCRSKVGLNPYRAKGVVGNYDCDSKRLTITVFDLHKDSAYLNQEWNPEKNPLIGDALNAYNDGPLEDGSQMGPFLEMESCSPAALIGPEEHLVHAHSVYHFSGDEDVLNKICVRFLGVSCDQLEKMSEKPDKQ